MPDYIPDPNNPNKQIPAPKNNADRHVMVQPTSMSKTPHYVYVTADLDNTAGFFYGTSASFSSKVQVENIGSPGLNNLSGSVHYQVWGGEATLKVGNKLDIHPLAWSGSNADKDKIMFVYHSGPDGVRP